MVERPLIVLAGGKGRRMGFPKDLLCVEGRRVIEATVERFRHIFAETLVVTDDAGRLAGLKGVRVVEDIVKGRGPLGGIWTGLRSIPEEQAFFMACDMPFLSGGVVRRVIEASEASGAECTAASFNGRIEPLCGVYSKTILDRLESALLERRLSVREFLKNCRADFVRCLAEDARSFINLNTPEDLKTVLHYGIRPS